MLVMSSSENEVYEVEKVIGKRKQGRDVNYLVRWKGYSRRHDSWEPASNLTGCKEIIKLFNAEQPKRLSQRKRRAPPPKELYSRAFSKKTHSAVRKSVGIARNRFCKRNQNYFLKPEILSEKIPLRKLTVGVGKLATSIPERSTYDDSREGCFTEESPVTVIASRTSSSPDPVAAALESSSTTKIWPPQKIFAVTGNRVNVKQWLSCKSTSNTCSFTDDHDYVCRPSAAYRNIIPKEPLNYQDPSNEQNTTSATRKSTLRRGRVLQERLVLLQWRQNSVEVIFANTSRKNALTPRFLKELSNALDAVVSSKCPVVVVNTVGKTFCSGIDIQFLIESLSSSKNVPATAKCLADAVRNFVDKLIEFERILIAIVQGPAVNLGCAMLTLFDLVYCSDKAWFWTPYVDMGQTPECCASLLFPEILGPVTANNMLLNGTKLTAHEAKMHGFVTEVFPHETLKRNAATQIENCAKKSPEALQISKSLIRSSNIRRLKQTNYCECSELAERWASQEFVEKSRQFVDSLEI